MDSIKIGNVEIGAGHKPLIIAEMSGNHNQSLERALQIVEAAAEAGAHCLKLQTYTADTITLNIDRDEFLIQDPQNLWKGNSLYKLYDQAHTPWKWHEAIMKRANELGMICFSSPFDETAVDFLENLNVPAYKIASFENNHLPLIKKVAQTGKPMIISTGMATLTELEDAVTTARENGCKELILLKCTSSYPANPFNTNLKTIPHLKNLFNCQVGLSDHTMGIGVAVGAISLGATVIEKHFTLNREDGGVDSIFSLEPSEFRALVTDTERAWQALGSVSYGPTEEEKKSLQYRRSLYIGQDMKAGDNLTPINLRCVRPGLGIAPKFYDAILGKTVKQNVTKGTPVNFGFINL